MVLARDRAAAPPGRDSAGVVTLPFVRAAHEQQLPSEADQSVLLAAGSTQVGVFELPATGWLRSIILKVDAAPGVNGAAVIDAEPDAPWSVIDSVVVTDPAGNEIFGPHTGYELYLINKYGGYSFGGDPRLSPAFTDIVAGAGNDGDFQFLLRIPIEASLRDGYASLPNQDSSAAYRMRIVQSPAASVFTVGPDTTQPTVRYRAWAEVWTQPTPDSIDGRAQAQQPPGVGTTQFWTREINAAVAGNNSIRVRRVGNMYRTLILVARTAAGVRMTTANLPQNPQWLWDGLILMDEDRDLRRHYMFEHYGYNEATLDLDNGVLVYDFMHDLDGKAGQELRNGLLPTTPATLLQFRGSFGVAGSLSYLVNDIQPVGLL